MPSDDDLLKPFADARASLRDNAKWVLSGAGAVVFLVLGGATISRLGSLEPDGWRLKAAVVFGLLGLGLCAIPLHFAIRLLKPEVISLQGMVAAADGASKQAVDKVDALLGSQLDGGSVRAFVREYYGLRAIAEAARDDDDEAKRAAVKAANDKLDEMQSDFAQVAQTCMTELVGIQFDELMNAVRWPAPAILVFLLVFAWAANPSSDPDKPLAAPLVRQIRPDAPAITWLKTTGLDPRCFTPLARVILLAEEPGGRVAGLLVSPGPGIECAPTRVVVVDDQVRAED